jgi:predicted anti-sigma-YlaC factor YlaD
MSTDTEFGNKACTQYEALLEDYLDGALSSAEATAAEQHWRNCAACRGALEHASASVPLLRFVGPSAGPDPAFARTVMARIRAAEHDGIADRAGFWQPFVRVG